MFWLREKLFFSWEALGLAGVFFKVSSYMCVLLKCTLYILPVGFTISLSSESLPECKMNMIIS